MLGLIILPIALALINRARGGGLGAEHLPGHPRFYAAPAAMLVSVPFVGPLDALAVGVAYLIWSLAPWGRWYDLGRLPIDYVWREETPFETAIARLSGNDHVAFTLRNLICLLPAAALLGWQFLALAPLMTLAYEVGWRATPATPIRTGELLTGALWGLFIAALL